MRKRYTKPAIIETKHLDAVIINDWAVTKDPYQAPEVAGIHLNGRVMNHPNHSVGHVITTSRVVDAKGRYVWTKSGTLYRLGRVNEKYRKFMRDNGIEYNAKNPIKVKGSMLIRLTTKATSARLGEVDRAQCSTKGAAKMMKQDLARKFFLDVYACGAVQIRERGKPIDGGLPVFSTDTYKEAQSLRVLYCGLERDGSGTYRLNPSIRPADVDGLSKVTDLFRSAYARVA